MLNNGRGGHAMKRKEQLAGGTMVLRDVGRVGQTHSGPRTTEKIARERKRRQQAIALLVCAMASWGLVALLYYFVDLTESYWPWSG